LRCTNEKEKKKKKTKNKKKKKRKDRVSGRKIGLSRGHVTSQGVASGGSLCGPELEYTFREVCDSARLPNGWEKDKAGEKRIGRGKRFEGWVGRMTTGANTGPFDGRKISKGWPGEWWKSVRGPPTASSIIRQDE